MKIQKNLHVNSSFECVYTEVFFLFFSFFHCFLIKAEDYS